MRIRCAHWDKFVLYKIFNIFSEYILLYLTVQTLGDPHRDIRKKAISILHLPGIPHSLDRIGEVESSSCQPNETCCSNENEWLF